MGRAERRLEERQRRKAAARYKPPSTPVRLSAQGWPAAGPRPPGTPTRATDGLYGSHVAPADSPNGWTTNAAARAIPEATSGASRHPADAATAGRQGTSSDQQLFVKPLEVTPAGCETLAEVEPQALGLTYWLDAMPDGEPYPVNVRFTGRCLKPRVDDSAAATTFAIDHTVTRVLPGSGRIAATVRVEDLAPGLWEVTATELPSSPGPGTRRGDNERARVRTANGSGQTGYAPKIRTVAPGVRLGAWPALVALGAVLAVVLQVLLAARVGLPVTSLVKLSALACLVGIVGAKVYYLAQNPSSLRGRWWLLSGMCLQGFVLAALATLITGSMIAGLPVGRVLDVSTPGLILAMGTGRVGCFLGGCCAGRPTASRWGMWSSDRTLGLRRIPVQLMESATALVIAALSLALDLLGMVRPDGVLFVASMAAYIFVRQLLFPLRDIARRTSWGRSATIVVSACLLTASVVLALLS